MRKHQKAIFVSILFILSVCQYCTAAFFNRDNLGTTSAAFMKLPMGSRAAGMGEAYCAAYGNPDAVYWNPAGLSSIRDMQISAMHAVWFEDIFYDYLTFAYPGRKGVAAVSVNYLGMDPIAGYYNTGAASGEQYSPYDIIIIISGAKVINSNMCGINIKFIQSAIDDEKALAFAGDIGYMKGFMDDRLFFGCSLQNAGMGIKYREISEPLPLNIKSGICYSAVPERLSIYFDSNFPIDNSPSVHAGGEYNMRVAGMDCWLRTGYRTSTLNDLGVTSGLSFGGGLGLAGVVVDYAWVPYGSLGSTHRISFRYTFSGKTRRVPGEEKIEKEEVLELKKKCFLKGRQYFAEEKYPESIMEFKKILEIDTVHFQSIKYIERAETEIKKKDTPFFKIEKKKEKKAVPDKVVPVSIAEQEEEEIPEPLKKPGAAEENEGVPDKESPGEAEVIGDNADVYAETEMTEEKITEIIESGKTGKEEYYLDRGMGYYERKKYDKAIKEFKKTLKIDPENKEAVEYIAIAEKIDRDHKEEKKISDYLKKGKKEFSNKKYQKAKKEFYKILEINNRHTEAVQYIQEIDRAIKEAAEKQRQEDTAFDFLEGTNEPEKAPQQGIEVEDLPLY
ncbi:MAG: PorV/PorQ family protein [Elusimicrobiota bacterium]